MEKAEGVGIKGRVDVSGTAQLKEEQGQFQKFDGNCSEVSSAGFGNQTDHV